MLRRTFLKAVAALPVVGKLFVPITDQWPPSCVTQVRHIIHRDSPTEIVLRRQDFDLLIAELAETDRFIAKILREGKTWVGVIIDGVSVIADDCALDGPRAR